MGAVGNFFAVISDYTEKISLGVSLCGFGLFLFTMYFTDLLLEVRLMSSVLIGTGLVGLLFFVIFWIKRHANVKAQQEREMFLSYKGEADEWKVKLTFNNIITVVGEFWSLGQFLYFSSHPGYNIFPYEYLDFDKNFSALVFKFPQFNFFIMFALSSVVIIALSLFFGFGFLVHKVAKCCCAGASSKYHKDVELGKMKKDDDAEETGAYDKEKGEYSTPSWNSFQRLILQVTSMFYVGIFTQALTALACVWDSVSGVPHLMRDSEMACYTGVHAFIATFTIAIAVFFFPLNTYLLTIGTQPPIKSDNGEVIFIRDAVLTFTLVELLCSSLKLFYSQPQYRTLYLGLIFAIYFLLASFLIYGRITKRPACNSRGMFYFKVSVTLAALLAVGANVAGNVLDESYNHNIVIALVYVGWPLIAVSYLIYLCSKGRRGSQAFRFTINMEALLKSRVIGFSLAVDNDLKSPPTYSRMDMMALFTPVGTPWHTILLVLALAGKRYVLATRMSNSGPLYDEARIIPASHITDPIDLEEVNMTQLIRDVYIRYVRKDLRKFLKTMMGREKYSEAKSGMSLNQMMDITYNTFVQNGMDQQLLKINYPHLANYMLERFCKEQPGNILDALANDAIRIVVTPQSERRH